MIYPDDFEAVWAVYPKRPGMNKKNTYKQWCLRLKQGCTVSQMLNGAKSYAEYCQATDTAGQYIKQPESFFGPSEHFDSDWTYEAPKPVAAWWSSESAMAIKAAEVGVKSRPGESIVEYRARIEAAIANGGKPPVPVPAPVVQIREESKGMKPAGLDLLALVRRG